MIARVTIQSPSQEFDDRVFNFGRLEAGRTGRAFGSDGAVDIDEIVAVRPGRVGGFDGVIHAIHDGRELDAQRPRARSGVLVFLRIGLGGFEQHPFLLIARNLPAIGGVGFPDIDKQELDILLVLLRDRVEGPNLGPEGRSRKAPEDKGDRLLAAEGGESNGVIRFHFAKVEVGGQFAGF